MERYLDTATSAEGVLGSSNESFVNLWARSTALREGCSYRFVAGKNPEDKLAFHMNTSPVVADEKYGKRREEEAVRLVFNKRIIPQGNPTSRIWYYPDEDSGADWNALERTQRKKGEE